MSRSVQISTEIPAPLSTVEHLGISTLRQKELAEIVRATIVRIKQEDSAAERPGAARSLDESEAVLLRRQFRVKTESAE